MYYGANFKETKSNGTYRYVYTGTFYPIRSGTTCPPGGKYAEFGAFYTENGVRIGCHRTTDFTTGLGEMRYFSVLDCPLDDYVLVLVILGGLFMVGRIRKSTILNSAN
ncbi:MAG: hypothetical protein EOO20_18295 [Chryseobacterium sp.]|nr:MAG: hypothetical protein EOO20_18295 [Chryseobacterium sp.]